MIKVQKDAEVEWFYRHDHLEMLRGLGFDEKTAVFLANKALTEHYMAEVHLALKKYS